MKTKAKATKTRDPARDKTRVPGQNPKADDSPEKDEHHDENRQTVEPQTIRR
ncbi:MAG TPA: hypothetical protein VLT36_07275 [Candidatus Dormibacteraeota bacterium]|nr:hypothetical protein [Candidatus Dormibacteraeota bacterium]